MSGNPYWDFWYFKSSETLFWYVDATIETKTFNISKVTTLSWYVDVLTHTETFDISKVASHIIDILMLQPILRVSTFLEVSIHFIVMLMLAPRPELSERIDAKVSIHFLDILMLQPRQKVSTCLESSIHFLDMLMLQPRLRHFKSVNTFWACSATKSML